MKYYDKDTLVKNIEWRRTETPDAGGWLLGARVDGVGRVTVLRRRMGYEGRPWDIETGFEDVEGNFFSIAGGYDAREYEDRTIGQICEEIKVLYNEY